MPKQNSAVKITVDGVAHILDYSELTAIDSKDFRREVGIPLASVLTDKEDVDLDVIAGLIWLARRKNEPGLTYETVARSVTLTSDVGLVDAEEEPAPEA